MERFQFLFQLAGHFRSLGVFLQNYGTLLAIPGLALSLLNCFFGFRLRKFWSAAAGFLAGAAAGLWICLHFDLSSAALTLLAALAGGLLCGAAAFLLYRAGLFLLCSGLTVFVAVRLLRPETAAALWICLLSGILVGILALLRERLTVSLATAIGGGLGIRGISAGPHRYGFPVPASAPDSALCLSGDPGPVKALEAERILG